MPCLELCTPDLNNYSRVVGWHYGEWLVCVVVIVVALLLHLFNAREGCGLVAHWGRPSHDCKALLILDQDILTVSLSLSLSLSLALEWYCLWGGWKLVSHVKAARPNGETLHQLSSQPALKAVRIFPEDGWLTRFLPCTWTGKVMTVFLSFSLSHC